MRRGARRRDQARGAARTDAGVEVGEELAAQGVELAGFLESAVGRGVLGLGSRAEVGGGWDWLVDEVERVLD